MMCVENSYPVLEPAAILPSASRILATDGESYASLLTLLNAARFMHLACRLTADQVDLLLARLEDLEHELADLRWLLADKAR